MPNKDWFNKTWNDYFSVGLVLNWNLNLGGKNAKRTEAARQRLAAARSARKDLKDALLTDRDAAHNNLNHAYQTYRTSEREYAIAVSRYNLARLRQQEGQLSVNRLLEMEADLAATERQYQAAIIQYYLAENEYLYAIGSHKIFGGLQ
jgi:outer membrane protein TolC